MTKAGVSHDVVDGDARSKINFLATTNQCGISVNPLMLDECFNV
jgi:hypothetical protein